jgi:hypothetical protein
LEKKPSELKHTRYKYEDGKLKLPDHQLLCDSIDQLFAINKEIPYLSMNGIMLSMRELNEIIDMTLPLQAIQILKLINNVDVCLEQDNQVQ